jgi:hypothetical protein
LQRRIFHCETSSSARPAFGRRSFKAIEDSKNGPGLDWAKIEARKARLVFRT